MKITNYFKLNHVQVFDVPCIGFLSLLTTVENTHVCWSGEIFR